MYGIDEYRSPVFDIQKFSKERDVCVLKKYLYIYTYIYICATPPPPKKKATRLKAIGFGDFSRSQCPQSTESKIATPKFGWQILVFFNLPPRPSRAAEPSTEKISGWGSGGVKKTLKLLKST